MRTADRAINVLYRAISWLDQRAPSERRYFRAAIFGSSRILPDDETYRQVQELARRLSYMGCDIVTGGGPGLMRAANEGARSGAYRHRTRSYGLTILLPLEEQPNPFLDEVAHHKTFFSRLHQFIRLSHAYIVVDGGIGTTLEALMVWQLLQVGVMERRPLIFVGPMWLGLRDWIAAEVIGRGLASPGDLDKAHWVATTDEALEIVERARNEFLRRHEVTLPPPVKGPEDVAADELEATSP
ncbi:MAG TPA: LOG family protein [Thermoanaerobaculia bacterium]|nr:LOG family protein [Thermoanaerobaculia bacterium]